MEDAEVGQHFDTMDVQHLHVRAALVDLRVPVLQIPHREALEETEYYCTTGNAETDELRPWRTSERGSGPI